jgi:hypothetical protein
VLLLCKNHGKKQAFCSRDVCSYHATYAAYVPDIHAAARNHPGADLELPPTCLLVYDREVVPKRCDYEVIHVAYV